MAQFYANVRGNRGKVTRMGTKASGISAHVRGWNVGVRVEIAYSVALHADIVTVHETGGSNNPSSGRLIDRLTSLKPL